jgi:hypothetical protein
VLAGLDRWVISNVTYIELMQGCKDKLEQKRLQKALKLADTVTLHITESISERSSQLIEAYALSHHLRLADALIAATALTHQIPVLTGNGKHFMAIKGLHVEIFKP